MRVDTKLVLSGRTVFRVTKRFVKSKTLLGCLPSRTEEGVTSSLVRPYVLLTGQSLAPRSTVDPPISVPPHSPRPAHERTSLVMERRRLEFLFLL